MITDPMNTKIRSAVPKIDTSVTAKDARVKVNTNHPSGILLELACHVGATKYPGEGDYRLNEFKESECRNMCHIPFANLYFKLQLDMEEVPELQKLAKGIEKFDF